MKIVVFTIGTQGDVRPFIALGQRLQALGHQVVIATASRHEALIRGGGLEHAPLDSDMADMMVREHMAMDAGKQIQLGRKLTKAFCDWVPTWVKQGYAATEGAGLIIGSGMGTVLGASFAERLGIPFVQAHFMPLTPSREIAPLWPPPKRPLPGRLNLAISHAARAASWRLFAAPAARIRATLGLPAFPWSGPWSYAANAADRRFILYAYSQHLVPHPADWPQESTVVTGNWFYDQADTWTPSPALEAFLHKGPKPIYVGFGSMMTGDPVAFTRTILDGIRASGQRAVIATGWGALEHARQEMDETLYFLDSAPHDWLFPRMSVAVHHGGAGTVGAAARAGLPQIIVPFIADQFFWSFRLKQISLSPMMISRKTITAPELGLAIRRGLSPAIRQRAALLAPMIGAEHGADKAVESLRRWGLLGKGVEDVSMQPQVMEKAAV